MRDLYIRRMALLQHILLKICMRQRGEKAICLFCFSQLFRIIAQQRQPYADDRVGIDRRIELFGKVAIWLIL